MLGSVSRSIAVDRIEPYTSTPTRVRAASSPVPHAAQMMSAVRCARNALESVKHWVRGALPRTVLTLRRIGDGELGRASVR